ncbi:hypothetical protein Csa_009333 [Cucumis sativus]|uniref:Uncharacterized protein n=1 Tax=Cucumis sativus TaxID=3659 RepID=A0A0A0KUK5_CUCSA|nr:hypothetical protein Csa_009333 [Cucumis sativus]
MMIQQTATAHTPSHAAQLEPISVLSCQPPSSPGSEPGPALVLSSVFHGYFHNWSLHLHGNLIPWPKLEFILLLRP